MFETETTNDPQLNNPTIQSEQIPTTQGADRTLHFYPEGEHASAPLKQHLETPPNAIKTYTSIK